jgi:2-keto-4-pentenoate hydratase
MTTPPSASSPITPWGRPIHGPTLPGQGVRCARVSPLTPAEVEEVAEIIARGRIERRSAVLPERLKTRNWDSIMTVMARLNAKLASAASGQDASSVQRRSAEGGGPSASGQDASSVQRRSAEGGGLLPAGWKVGAASLEIQRAEGVPGPAPGLLNRNGVYESPAHLPAHLFINYRCSECEFAFRMAEDLPPRDSPYTEVEVAGAVEALLPALEIGDTVFEDWYGASGYQGSSLDNGGAAAFVHGAPIRDWRRFDLPAAKIDLYLNGQFMKSGYGRAAMGNPQTSLTWMANWLRERGQGLHAGEFVSTGTCTGHFFAARGDRLDVDFGEIGKLVVTYD